MIYELLQADTAEDLQIKVNQKLADNWELYGNLVTETIAETSEIRSGIAFNVESKIILFQAMIKKESSQR